MKALIFDSGTIINLSMNGLLSILESLKKSWSGKFLITQAVKKEIIDRPKEILRFELGALMIERLLQDNVLELPSALSIDDNNIKEKTGMLMDQANHTLQYQDQWIPLVSEAEMSCLALSDELKKKGWETMIAIDERTTRLLGESPDQLEQLMSAKLHKRIVLSPKSFGKFTKYNFIRSSELVYVAYKKGLIPIEGKKVLEALLYATKFKGAAISFEEINSLKKM